MTPPDPHILATFPYPVAYPYSLVFAEHEPPSKRRWALWFTVYQLLRMVGLPLVSQYVCEPITAKTSSSIAALNRAITALRSPHFSDWISLVGAMLRYLPQVGVTPLFSQLNASLAMLTEVKRRPFGISGRFDLPPLEAILALRNGVAHGGMPDESAAVAHLHYYLSDLQQILSAFAWLGEYTLVSCGENAEDVTDYPASVQVLRGVTPTEVLSEYLPHDLQEVLQESPTALVAPDGRILPLFPFFTSSVGPEPVYLYDGHVAIQIESDQQSERSTIHYLGVSHVASDARPVMALRALLASRQVSFALRKEQTAPWTIADSAADFSRRTVDDLVGTKYFPSYYIPFTEIEDHFRQFLTVPDPSRWPSDTTRARYVNGLILAGPAGAGKTAFLTRQVAMLLTGPSVQIDRENPNLVLFLRGDGIINRPHGVSLLQEVAEKLGLTIGGASGENPKGKKTDHGFRSFRELFAHLHTQWKNDRVLNRRFILVLDALNEAPQAELVVREALTLVKEAARYPWLKVILSLRQEWFTVLFGKLGAQEQNPIEEIRPYLYTLETTSESTGARLPLVTLEPLSEEQARLVYERYQNRAHPRDPDGRAAQRPTCLTLWPQLPAETRLLLRNPLYLHLFVEAFDGRQADPVPVATVVTIFQRYVERALQKQPGLQASVSAVVAYLLRSEKRLSANLSDDDAHAIRHTWASAQSPTEARLSLNPVEALVHEGFMQKRVRDDGGGYRFVFQIVAEYLLYRDLVENRSAEKDALSYWTSKAHAAAFPEYMGAFGFLLREWADRGDYTVISHLVEAAPPWLGGVLTTLLVEQVQRTQTASENTAHVETVMHALTTSGGERCVEALLNAGVQLTHSRFALAARVYLEAGISLAKKLSLADPEKFSLTYLLAIGSSWLGNQLASTGRVAEADALSQSAVALLQSLCLRHPRNLTFGLAFAGAWEDRAALLSACGQDAQATHAYEESLGLYQALRKVFPDPVTIDKHLGWTFSRYGVVLERMGRVVEAERLHRQAIAVLEPLWKTHSVDCEIGSALSGALSNLGAVLDSAGRGPEAVGVCQRAVLILEALWKDYPARIDFGRLLAGALLNLGGVLAEVGQRHEAEQRYLQALTLCESLRPGNSTDRETGITLSGTLMNLGLLSSAQAQWGKAEQCYQRAAGVLSALWAANPQDPEVGHRLADIWTNLGQVCWETGRLDEAVMIAREAVALYQKLWQENPLNTALADALDAALQNLLIGLLNTGEENDAERIAVEIVEWRRDRWAANPNDIDSTVRYAEALCHSQQFAEASRLLDGLLAQVPDHPSATQLRQHLANQRFPR